MRRASYLVGLAAMIALLLTLSMAHADVSLTVATQDGATVFSLPTPPDGVSYPADLTTAITGTASFDNADGSVRLEYRHSDDPADAPASVIRQAALTCNASNACTWTSDVPFVVTPGAYRITVIAEQATESGPAGTSSSIDVTIL